MNKRNANVLHSHEGRRLHDVGGVLFEKMLSWCALRTGCMFLSLLLVGMCATSFGDLVSRLVSEVILEKEVDFLPPVINCITERILFYKGICILWFIILLIA